MASSVARVLLDAGVFILVARSNRMTLALMKLAAGRSVLHVAAHTFAEFYRGGQQSAREAQLVKQWRPEIISIAAAEGKLAGELLARSNGDNSMDALVVAAAALHGIGEIYTSDPTDLRALRSVLPSGARQIDIVDVQ
ncbi:MAG: PIN domain-containing protein [Candidatus Elarobacter sp.]